MKDAASLIMFAVKKQNIQRPEKDMVKDFLLKWLPTFYKLQNSEEASDERYFNLMYTGNAHFLFFRLHGLICDRLTQIRDRAVEIVFENGQIGDGSDQKDTSIANSIGMKNNLGVNPDEYYPAFLELVKAFSDGSVDGGLYEDTLREMFTTKAYIAFTMDKLIQSR
jgi:paired amphipathic helix protein Sin3a